MAHLRLYIFTPVLFVVVLFALDKIFLLPEVRLNFIQPGGMLYYAQRKRQLGRLHQYLDQKPANKEVALVFGDSRSFALGDVFAHGAGHTELAVFNFAGPQALPAYHAYLAERIFAGRTDPGKKPKYLLIGISPDALSRNSGVFAVPNLSYGVDAAWIQANRTHIPERDYATYINTRRYALAGLQFSFKTLMRRLKGGFGDADSLKLPPVQVDQTLTVPGLMAIMGGASEANLSHYSLSASPQARILDLGKGAQYAWFGSATAAALKEDTARLVRLYLQSFALSGEQLFFLERTLRIARTHGVRTIVFFPQVNPYMHEVYKREPSIAGIRDRVAYLARSQDALAVDLNTVPEVRCTQFYDASHLSFNCFGPVAAYLLKRVKAMPAPGSLAP